MEPIGPTEPIEPIEPIELIELIEPIKPIEPIKIYRTYPAPWSTWTLEPLVLGTPPISSSYSPPWVWFGYGVRGGVSCDIGE